MSSRTGTGCLDRTDRLAIQLAAASLCAAVAAASAQESPAPPALAATSAAAAAPAPVAASGPAWARAQCVAALETQTEGLAQRVKAGETALTETLRLRLRAGAAFIGQAWLEGERDEQRSKALLQQARLAQQGLPAEELAARQERCALQGEKLLSESNMFSRAAVSRLAERRMKKLLGG